MCPYMGRRRLIWAHIWAQEGLYEPQKAYAPEGLYGPQEAYMGPHMGPRRLMWAPEGLYAPYMGPIHKALIRL